MLKSGCAVNVALRSRRKEGQPKGGGKPNRGKKGSPKEEERKAAQKRMKQRQPKRGGKPTHRLHAHTAEYGRLVVAMFEGVQNYYRAQHSVVHRLGNR